MIYATEQQVVVTSAVVAVVALVALAVGVWWGSGREREYVAQLEEELEDLEERLALGPMPPEIAHELDAAVARHPAGKVRPAVYRPPDWAREATETWLAAREEPETVLMPSAVLSPDDMSWTGEIAKMTAEFQRDMERLLGGTDDKLKEITR